MTDKNVVKNAKSNEDFDRKTKLEIKKTIYEDEESLRKALANALKHDDIRKPILSMIKQCGIQEQYIDLKVYKMSKKWFILLLFAFFIGLFIPIEWLFEFIKFLVSR